MEKRKFSRVDFNVEVILNVGNIQKKGTVENLSLNGILVIPEEEILIKANELVDIQVLIMSDSSRLLLEIPCIVLRNDQNGIALNFVTIDVDTFIHIRNILAYNSGNYEKIMEEFFTARQD